MQRAAFITSQRARSLAVLRACWHPGPSEAWKAIAADLGALRLHTDQPDRVAARLTTRLNRLLAFHARLTLHAVHIEEVMARLSLYDRDTILPFSAHAALRARVLPDQLSPDSAYRVVAVVLARVAHDGSEDCLRAALSTSLAIELLRLSHIAEAENPGEFLPLPVPLP